MGPYYPTVFVILLKQVFLVLMVKFNVQHVFVYGIITTEVQGTTFPEENTVYCKEIKKTQGENLQSDETSMDMLYTEPEKLHTNRLWHVWHVDYTHHSFTGIYCKFSEVYTELNNLPGVVDRIHGKSRDSRGNTVS